ncbi:hypothetical protein FOC4_g10000234 [Fusarium odoratissimum]|uniref:endo-polygalacturonase n=1 Tax=Fusarium oxysporum f. sp. cubense (strain race 4) TaxID=2502994 RepID=N1SA61_FUSC4|nr:hypothetical protein FOC4_g10000234 [Fusarium odoratissimum]
MIKFGSALFLTALANTAMTAPSYPEVHTYNDKWDPCTFSDASKAMAGQSNCTNLILNNVAVPAGTTLDLTKLQSGAKVTFQGTTTWDYKEWEGPLLSIAGNKITVEGASDATLNADGARWWDGKGDKGKTKPKFFAAHKLTNSTIKSLYIKNTPVQAVSINGVNGLNIDKMTIDNADGDSKGGHNTDGFDIGDSTGVTITGAKVYNQDDCVAVNSGTDITFSGGFCSGGHGLSIGSVGNRDNNVVDNVKFLNSQVTKSDNGIRVKTVKGGSGKVAGVTYSGITLSNIAKYGVIVEQNYYGGDLKGEPTSSLPITGLTIKDITGTGAVSSSGYNIAIVCGSSGCSNWTWSNVNVTGGKTYGSCENVPSVASC